MIGGLFAGIMWGLETVILGIALRMSGFVASEQAILLAPFVSTFLHDAFSAVFLLTYNVIRGKGRELLRVCKSSRLKWLILSSAIGGPVGMTGYVMAINYMGASIGAVASAVYPAIGAVLAYLFLKESVKWHQWGFLAVTLLGVYGLSYSPGLSVENFWLGLLGVFMCAFGWGIEGVVLASCFKDPTVKSEYALTVRQTTSALLYGGIILPILGGWHFTGSLLTGGSVKLLFTVAMAALCATVSYLFYYRTISRIGVSRAMALNITYTAWALLFSVILLRDVRVLNPLTLCCAAVVVICGILASTDLTRMFGRKRRTDKS